MPGKNYETPKILHDAPAENGRIEFHFEDYAATLARLIADRETETPLAIGVSGSWGSGKTTLLKRVQSMLLRTPSLTVPTESVDFDFVNSEEEERTIQARYRPCRTVWFNAWKYSDEDELLIALVRVIVQTMFMDDFIARNTAKIFNPFIDRRDVIDTILSWFSIRTPFGIDLNINIKKRASAPLSKKLATLDLFDDAFNRLMAVWVHRTIEVSKLEPKNGVLVIFIDDLDRCLPEKTVQVLEAIKLFMDKHGCIFVLGADVDLLILA